RLYCPTLSIARCVFGRPFRLVTLYVLHFLTSLPFFAPRYGPRPDLHSFPTRRSSDLSGLYPRGNPLGQDNAKQWKTLTVHGSCGDRRSTRLNSSHVSISYAVFCLKKKKTQLPSCTPRGVSGLPAASPSLATHIKVRYT